LVFFLVLATKGESVRTPPGSTNRWARARRGPRHAQRFGLVFSSAQASRWRAPGRCASQHSIEQK
jgi:hypothetical protein